MVREENAIEAARAMRDRILANLSHEFQTPLSAQIAPAKARTSALGRKATLDYETMINAGRTAFVTVPGVDGLLEGGVPIMAEGHCIGAVGVSGVKSSEDAQIARAGIAALAV